LNYIAANLDRINESILLNGDLTHEPMAEENDYWSSTSMCRITDWNNNNHEEKQLYKVEPTYIGWSSFGILPSLGVEGEERFNLEHQICNGSTMLTQNMSTKNTFNKPRNTGFAFLRPVRRIPILIGCHNIDIETEYTNYDFAKCNSCVGFSNCNGGYTSTGSGGGIFNDPFSGGIIVE
jgi:hypothetical protein